MKNMQIRMVGISLAKVIRLETWETNSSSTHSLAICNQSQLDDWRAGRLFYGINFGRLFTIEQIEENFEEFQKKCTNKEWLETYTLKQYMEEGYQSFDEWYESEYLQTYIENHITPEGESIVCFGKFGFDG